jgi:hypothetical protein
MPSTVAGTRRKALKVDSHPPPPTLRQSAKPAPTRRARINHYYKLELILESVIEDDGEIHQNTGWVTYLWGGPHRGLHLRGAPPAGLELERRWTGRGQLHNKPGTGVAESRFESKEFTCPQGVTGFTHPVNMLVKFMNNKPRCCDHSIRKNSTYRREDRPHLQFPWADFPRRRSFILSVHGSCRNHEHHSRFAYFELQQS